MRFRRGLNPVPRAVLANLTTSAPVARDEAPVLAVGTRGNDIATREIIIKYKWIKFTIRARWVVRCKDEKCLEHTFRGSGDSCNGIYSYSSYARFLQPLFTIHLFSRARATLSLSLCARTRRAGSPDAGELDGKGRSENKFLPFRRSTS